MVDGNTIRLSKLARECNVGIHTIVEFLHKKGFHDIDSNPNTKVSAEAVQLLEKEYKVDMSIKKESEQISLKSHRPKKESISIDDLDDDDNEIEEKPAPKVSHEKKEPKVEEVIIPVEKIDKFKVVGKIDLNTFLKPKKQIVVEKRPEVKVVPKVEKQPEPQVEKQPEPKVEKQPEVVVEKQPEPKIEKQPEKKEPVIVKKVKEEPVAEVSVVVPEKEETPEVEIYVHSPRTSKFD